MASVDGLGPGRARVQVAIVPRFALSVTTTTLAALGELYDEFRDRGVYVTTHLSENGGPEGGEVAEVRARFGVEQLPRRLRRAVPAGLARGRLLAAGPPERARPRRALPDGEFARLAETGASVAHCPVSQQFLGSGTMPWLRAAAGGMTSRSAPTSPPATSGSCRGS